MSRSAGLKCSARRAFDFAGGIIGDGQGALARIGQCGLDDVAVPRVCSAVDEPERPEVAQNGGHRLGGDEAVPGERRA